MRIFKKLFFESEFEQQIRLYLKYGGYPKQQIQRQAMTHAGRFYGREMLTADIKDLCQLFLGISLFLPIISDCVGQVFHALGKVKIPFQNYHHLTDIVYPKAAQTKINFKASLTLIKRRYIIETLFCWMLCGVSI